MDWENLKYFVALGKAGSITKAADTLGVNYTTVSRRVAQLEQELNTKLFERLSSGIALTKAGQEMFEKGLEIGQSVAQLEHHLGDRNSATSGHITLTAGQNIATLLAPCLKAFAEEYPQIHLELLVSPMELDLEAKEADISIRCTNQAPEALIGRCFGTTSIAPYAQRGMIDTTLRFGDLAAHPWITWDEKRVGNSTAKFNDHYLPPRCHRVLSVSDARLQLEAVKSGMGLAWLWRFVGDAEPDLEVVSKDHPIYEAELWLLMHSELKHSQRHRLLYDHLAMYLQQHPQLSGIR